MSFVGAISRPMRKIISGFASDVHGAALLPCGGNFTMGAALRSGGFSGLISGCDITLYSSALGSYLAGDLLAVAERPDCPEHLQGFLDASSPLSLAASLSIMLDLHMVWKNQNAWHARVLRQYRQNWPTLMEKTIAKLEAYKAHMAQGSGFRYAARDAVAFLDDADKENAVLIFPPTYGSKGYVNMEKHFSAAFDWQPPSFTEISFDDAPIYEKITSFRQWLIVMDRPFPEHIAELVGEPVAVFRKNERQVHHVYARQASSRVVVRSFMKSMPVGAVFPSDKRVTGEEEVGIAQLKTPQATRLTELFMSCRVDYCQLNGISLGFCLDGKLIGKADFQNVKFDWKMPGEGRQIYQLSDLAVPSAEPRLSKLVLLLVQSHEVKKLVDGYFKDDFRWTCTTAFCKGAVSMKYRGVYKLHKRLPGENGMNRLNYFAPLGQWSMREAYEIWLKKYRK